MKKIIPLLLIIISCIIKVQASQKDSLELLIEKTKYDTAKVRLYIELCYIVEDEYIIDNAIKAVKISQKELQNKQSKATELIYKKYLAEAYNVIGYMYNQMGDVVTCLDYYFKTLKLREQLNNKAEIAEIYNNIGAVYDEQGNFEKGLEYYKKCLKIREELGDKDDISLIYNNIGVLLSSTNKIEEGLQYYEKSLKLRREVGNIGGIATCLTNIGYEYRRKGDLKKALAYYEESYILRKQINNKEAVSTSLNNIAAIYYRMNNLNKAISYSEQSLALAKELGFPRSIRDAASTLSMLYESQGNCTKAYPIYRLFIEMRDSVDNLNTRRESLNKALQYNYEKKSAADSVAYEKEKEIKEVLIEKQNTEIKVKRNQQFALFGGLAVAIVFAGFVVNRYKLSQKQKNEIEKQKHIVEEKNKEILDSITYAKRIQTAILPPQRIVKEYLPNSFILYKPKDIVAGDFYWMETKGDLIMFAAADCTGHGVPGAMVSVICNNGLNRSVKEFGIVNSGKILDKAREIVVNEFEKSDEEVKDGMDISLCVLNTKTNLLQWSGANNPLWIVRNEELIEYKADKQPIGKYAEAKPFTTNEIELLKGDAIYIFTDGYADQFGGDKGKKYKASKLKDLILSIQNNNMDTQKTLIDKSFEEWKGSLEQIDDVCIIGVKV